jgi:cyclic pyranopterin phosphate synthase
MVDVSGKDVTPRTAKAHGRITLGPEAFAALKAGQCPKGDVLATAKIAAINAVKMTPAIIPMCHTILVEAVDVDFVTDTAANSASVNITVRSTGKTGVEMEALAGAAAACLTIYDMLKYTGRDMVITEIKLIEKTGGKSGDYKRQN